MSNNAKNLPEVKLGQYKGLAVTRHVRPLSEKTIDQEMVHQTRMRSVYHNSTSPAKRGSRVLLDFVGFMDGEEIPDSRMEKVMVVLGDGKLMPAADGLEALGDGAGRLGGGLQKQAFRLLRRGSGSREGETRNLAGQVHETAAVPHSQQIRFFPFC